MNARPIRLGPGADLRRALEALARAEFAAGAFVLAGIGSLHGARLRLAGRDEETVLAGDVELLTLSGTVTTAGAHLHLSVADAQGRVLGGHLCHGNTVRTTCELLLAAPAGWPWHRVVSADGSLGTPKRRPDGTTQAELLRREGLVVSGNRVAAGFERAFVAAGQLDSGLPPQKRPADAPVRRRR